MTVVVEPETSGWRFTGVLSVLAASQLPNPYPCYAEVREAGTFHSGEIGSSPITLVTTHAEASAALADPAVGHGYRDGVSYRGTVRDGIGSLLRADPPDHGRLRRLVGRAFTPAVVATLASQVTGTMHALLDDALATVRDHGHVDAVAALTRPMPLRVMCQLLGVPDADEATFGGWADAMTRGIDPRPLLTPEEHTARAEATDAFHDYFRAQLDRRRAEPRDDLLSRLVASHDDGDALSESELLELCTLLLIAGYETTVNLLGGAILALLAHPDQLAALRADPALIAPAVEEILRYDPPIQFIARTVLADTEIGGRRFTRGDGLVIAVGAANRDPAAFDDPDSLRLTRFADRTGTRRHLAFGSGIHYCLGAPLARVEAELALRTLLSRVDTLALAGAVTYRRQIVIRGVRTLPLHLAV